MRTQLRIVAGTLRGRKLTCTVRPELRPTPQMVREALFSILGNAVPDRPFVDIFAGTGVNALEALSRGARSALLVEWDFRQAQEIDQHLRTFQLSDRAQVVRTDAYRWIQHWRPPAEPLNVFLSPPFRDLESKKKEFLDLVALLQAKVAAGSVLAIQAEKHTFGRLAPAFRDWEQRRYGRNLLLLWVKEEPACAPAEELPD
jgi:16S rRNA (guanine966-N2)-methyltransferase